MSRITSSFLRFVLGMSVLVSLQGCDFFRVLAGRETSADLAVINEKMEAVKAEEARRRTEDSLARLAAAEKERMRIADSLVIASSGRDGIPQFRRVEELAFMPDTLPDFRFALMMGYFRRESNASRLFKMIEDDGFSPIIVHFAGGAAGVAVFPSETAAEVMDGYGLVKGKPYCPEDAWVIWNGSWNK